MKKSRMKILCTVIGLIILMPDVISQTFDGSKTNLWLGGAFNVQSYGMTSKEYDYKSDRMNIIQFSPVARFFPANHFCLGPKIEWTGLFSGGESENILSLGGEFGFVYGFENIIPYMVVSPYESVLFDSDDNMFVVPVTAGIMIPIKDVIGLQLEFGVNFGFEKNYNTNIISIGIGICGLGEKTAVSFLNKLSLY